MSRVGEMPRRTLFIIISSLLLAVLVIHISKYFFLCDDAFISFRYAKNFANGLGLVFNPGERVEGYTNFLWVLVLSFFSLLGIAPDQPANILSIALSISLFALFFYFNQKILAIGKYDYFILLGSLFLVSNRTFAVWSTSGLETALFSFLIFGSVMMLVRSLNDTRRLWLSALLFSLTALTRPEGILLFASFFGYYLLLTRKDRSTIIPIARASLIFACIIGAHFIFRLLYYGYPLPNTFYAKVTGGWHTVGAMYLLLFIHEYGLYFLIVPVLYIFGRFYEPEKRRIIKLMTIPFIPYLVYLVYIGGDHFEFRPFMPMVSILAILMQESVRATFDSLKESANGLKKYVVVIYLLAMLFLWFIPPYLSNINFPDRYQASTTICTAEPGTIGSKIPILNRYLAILDSLHGRIVKSYICVRQEEHKMAFEEVFRPQAMMLKDMVDRKFILPDETISLHCVGAIPYYSGLPTIDRLGLTDAHVAHTPIVDVVRESLGIQRLIGHERRADWNYLVERKVVYLSTNPSMFFFPQDQFMKNGILDTARIPPSSILVPLENNQVFVFASTFPPTYFQNTLNARGLCFFYKSPKDEILYSPAAGQPK